MITLVMLVALAQPSAPCTDVVDRTPGCAAPSALPSAIAADAKRVEAVRFDVATLPAELGIVSAGLALGGGAGLVLGLATTPNNEHERLAQSVAALTGTGLLVWSALVGAGAAALWLFDPASGEVRPKIFPDRE